MGILALHGCMGNEDFKKIKDMCQKMGQVMHCFEGSLVQQMIAVVSSGNITPVLVVQRCKNQIIDYVVHIHAKVVSDSRPYCERLMLHHSIQ